VPDEQNGTALIELYSKFISDFESKLDPLKLAQIIVVVSRQYSEPSQAFSFLKDARDKLKPKQLGPPNAEAPALYVAMQMASLQLSMGDLKETKTMLDTAKAELEKMVDVDQSVHACVHWVTAQYHKARQEFTEFYRSTLLYLAYVPMSTLTEPIKLVCVLVLPL
jgi:26S proteasome regulatory subunit N9